MASTLLVANRGEIVLRIFRTAKRMGLRTVAVFSDADSDAPHVRAADVAVRIGPAPATESYLRADRIIEAALQSHADLVHPGYGFLAEDDRFASDCERSGITFVGPPSDVLRVVGDKASARALAEAAGVPVFAGYAGDDQSDDALRHQAALIGFPVIVKPAGGGGGKGMTVVTAADALDDALRSARRIAESAFDDDRLILERYIDRPRHVEVQVLADTHGNVIHLGERDCSLQRRHQKILEESPAPNLADDVRARLHDAAVRFAAHANYVGAGTCEFLVSTATPERSGGAEADIGFIEMNARLQVEHPVTEMVTGLDLVELQLRVAQGETLALMQNDVASSGHAIEVRVYAEDPDGFLPQAGRVLHVRWPTTGGSGASPDERLRVDTGIEEGTDVSTHYDPLLAKVIVHGADRDDALDRLRRALAETEILGLRTNLAFLTDVTAESVVRSGEITTDWLERSMGRWHRPVRPDDEVVAALVAAAAEMHRVLGGRTADPWSALGAWRAGGEAAVPVVLRTSGSDERVYIVEGHDPFVVRAGQDRGGGVHGRAASVSKGDDDRHAWLVDAKTRVAAAYDTGASAAAVWHVWVRDSPYEFLVGPAPRSHASVASGRIESPLPGQVVAVRVNAGELVAAGDELVVVEAMKMEHSIKAPSAGIVRAVLCVPGDQVDRGRPLVDFDPS